MTNDFFDRIERKEANIEGAQYPLNFGRVWGDTVTLDANTRINRITREPSLHYHNFRTEDYIIHSGEAIVYRGALDKTDLEKTVSNLRSIIAKPGDKLIIPPKIVHTIVPASAESVTMIEISHGPYEESDITRIYDKSGRDAGLVKKWEELGYRPGLGIADMIPLAKAKRKGIVGQWKSDLPRPKGYEDYSFPTTVTKPWGWERWLELWEDRSVGRGYCMKHLFIKADTRTSFQLHNKKTETNFLIQGEAEAYLENEKGDMEMRIMRAGDPDCDTWTIPAGKPHRIHTLTDIYLVEASTWDVDDVVRLGDDYGRGSGKIDSEHEKAKKSSS
jgi:mannose-6-phosphate isomerase-like protein (cupin superfamily)